MENNLLDKKPKYLCKIPYSQQRCRYCWKRCGRGLTKHLKWKHTDQYIYEYGKYNLSYSGHDIYIPNKYIGRDTDSERLIIDCASCYYQKYFGSYLLFQGYKNKKERIESLIDLTKLKGIKVSNKIINAYTRLSDKTEELEDKVSQLYDELYEYAQWYDEQMVSGECGRDSKYNRNQLIYSREWNKDKSKDKIDILREIMK